MELEGKQSKCIYCSQTIAKYCPLGKRKRGGKRERVCERKERKGGESV